MQIHESLSVFYSPKMIRKKGRTLLYNNIDLGSWVIMKSSVLFAYILLIAEIQFAIDYRIDS